jgi:hypothetical protein
MNAKTAYNDARGRGQQRTDENRGVGEAATYRAEQLAHGFEQVLGHARAFEDQAHECEERYGEQRVVGHHAVYSLGQRTEQRP